MRGLNQLCSLELRMLNGASVGGSNLGKNARYDQILHLPTVPENFTNAGGAVDFHIDDAHIEGLFPGRGYTREKFTYQMSDHFPVWIQEDGS